MLSLNVAAAGLAVIGLTSGCSSAKPAQPTPARAPSALALKVTATSSARSVASAFVVAWGSYDAVHDASGAFAARCRPYVTRRLADELADDRPAVADWAAKRRLREKSVLQVAALRRPDGAPPPSAQRMYLRVYADRITTNRHGRWTTPTGVTVVLVHRDRRWLVDRVLFV